MTYEAAMIPVRRPGFFNPIDVEIACDFIINNKPPTYIKCDHEANVRQARVVQWANHDAVRQERAMGRK